MKAQTGVTEWTFSWANMTHLSWQYGLTACMIVWAYSLHETADGRSLQAAPIASSSPSILVARRGLPVQFQRDFAFNFGVRKAHFTSQLIYTPACDFPVPFLKHFTLNRFTQLASSQLWSLQFKAYFEGFMLIYHFLWQGGVIAQTFKNSSVAPGAMGSTMETG